MNTGPMVVILRFSVSTEVRSRMLRSTGARSWIRENWGSQRDRGVLAGWWLAAALRGTGKCADRESRGFSQHPCTFTNANAEIALAPATQLLAVTAAAWLQREMLEAAAGRILKVNGNGDGERLKSSTYTYGHA